MSLGHRWMHVEVRPAAGWCGKELEMLTSTRDRIGAACGAAFVAIIFIGNGMATSGESSSTHPTGQEVLQHVAHAASSTTATIGFMLELAGFVLFFPFLGYLADVLRRHTADRRPGIAGATAIVAAITMLAIKLGSAASVVALSLDRDRLDPQLAMVLNDINGAAFLVSWLPFAVFVGALAVALRQVALIGRPTAYVGIAAGTAGVVLTILGLHDPLNAIPLAFVAGMFWVLVVGVRLAVKPGARVPVRTEPEPVSVGA
jgi:hypothetical protein